MTIKSKLIIGISVVSAMVFIGFAAFSLSLIHKMQDRLQAGLEREGVNLIQATADATNLTLPSRDYDLVKTYADTIVAEREQLLEFTIYDEDGEVVYDFSRRGKTAQALPVKNQLHSNGTATVHTHTSADECELVGVLTFHSAQTEEINNLFGYVRLVLCSGDINAIINKWMSHLAVFFLVMLAAESCLLFFGVHRLIIKPIRHLTDGIRRIQAGDREHRVRLATRDEFATLAQAFNLMIADLNKLMVVERQAALAQAAAETQRQKNHELEQAYEEQKQLNAQIQRARENLNQLLDSMPVGVILTTPDDVICHINSTALSLSGYACEQDIIGHLTHKQLLSLPEGDKKHSGCQYERLLVTRTNQQIPVLVTRTQLHIDQQDIIVRAFIDITDHKKDQECRMAMEMELNQARRLESIGTLAAGVAHEINSPIQYIGSNSLFVSTATEEILDVVISLCALFEQTPQDAAWTDVSASVQDLLKSIDLDYYREEVPNALRENQEGVQRVAGIVAAMKDFSHMSSTEKKPEDLNAAINSTVTLSRNEWKYVADLKTDLSENLPFVECAIGEIKQTLLNIIINASHAIETHNKKIGVELGHITITSQTKDETVLIAITDTGGGIPTDIQNRVFDPFFTTKAVGKGTGQGLTISYQAIVEKHGGKLWFETEPGQGTTFFIQLPVQAPLPQENQV